MNKGQTQLSALGNNTEVDPFGNNAAAAFAYKKVERLVTATHMVTNYVPNTEPLREKVRDIASKLLTDTIKLRDGFTSLGKGALGNITAQVRLELSLLDALHASGLISEMNLRVLKNAYVDFTKNLSAMAEGSMSDGVELTPEFFSQAQNKAPKQAQLGANTGQIASAQTAKVQDKSAPKVAKDTKVNTATKNHSNDRLSTIVEFITKRGNASTGDIAQIITGCSSKTLQRDLGKLVSDGILQSSGSKRWTRYSLA